MNCQREGCLLTWADYELSYSPPSTPHKVSPAVILQFCNNLGSLALLTERRSILQHFGLGLKPRWAAGPIFPLTCQIWPWAKLKWEASVSRWSGQWVRTPQHWHLDLDYNVGSTVSTGEWKCVLKNIILNQVLCRRIQINLFEIGTGEPYWCRGSTKTNTIQVITK